MHRRLMLALVLLGVLFLSAASAPARIDADECQAADCQFVLGFKAKVDGETMTGEVQMGDFGTSAFTAKKKK